MNFLRTNSSGSKSHKNRCLICCSESADNDEPKLNTKSSCYKLIKAVEKICQCLLLPQEHFQKVKDKNWMSFCSKCNVIVDEIIELQRKSEILELEIQWKVETLGRIAIIDTVPGSKGKNGREEERVAEVRNVFKVPVTRNFLQGLLPNPCVKLGRTVNVDTKAVIQLGQVRDVIYSAVQKSSTCKSKNIFNKNEHKDPSMEISDDDSSNCNILEEQEIKIERDKDVKVEVDEEIIISKVDFETEDYDSNDDLFEIFTRPVLSISREEEITTTGKGTDNDKTLEILENVEITRPQEEEYLTAAATSNKNLVESTSEIYNGKNIKYSPIMSKQGGGLDSSLTIRTAKTSLTTVNDKSKENVSCSKLSVLPIDEAEINLQNGINYNQESIVIEDESAEMISTGQKKTSEMMENDIDIDESEKFQPRSPNSVKDRSSDYEHRNDIDADFQLSEDDKEEEDNSDFDSGLIPTPLPKSRYDIPTRPGNVINSTEGTSTSAAVGIIRDPAELNKELEGLIEGRDYSKCTKCDYVAKKSSTFNFYENKKDQHWPSSFRKSVAHHYSIYHNPVNATDASVTDDGKDCYKCTKCDFSIVFQSNTPSVRDKSYRELSLHYIRLHDVFERQCNKSLTEGIDYFLCPLGNCSFVAFIKKETDNNYKQQLQNAIEARETIIEHYRSSRLHLEERKNTLSDITKTPLVFKDVSLRFYKCTKCDFKSYVRIWDNEVNRYGRARKRLAVHYLQEYILPWANFPGLFKYGCYKEECEGGDVLKCAYFNCDYFNKILRDLEGKTREECEIVAYQSFADKHASSHNFNSVSLKDLISSGSCEKTANVESSLKIIGKRKRKRFVRSCVSKKLKTVPNPNEQEMISYPESDRLFNGDSQCDSLSSKLDGKHQSGSTVDVDSLPKRRKWSRKRNQVGKPKKKSFDPQKLLEGLTEGEDFLKCTKCDYFTLSPKTKIYKQARGPKKFLRRNITTHYANKHIPIKKTDLSKTPDGEDCYKCTKCGFYSVIGDSGSQGSLKRSLYTLSLHYIDLHDAFERKKIQTKDSLKNLVEAVDYYRCPETNCDFYVMINGGRRDPAALGRYRILNHFNLCHNPELRNVLLNPVLDEADGIVCFRCSQCDFKSVVGKEKNQSEAKKIMKFHFTRTHLLPWRTFQGLYKYKITEEKSGDDDEVIRCSQPGCDFSTKVNYIEGESREKCRIKALKAVRFHSTFHSVKHNKGYYKYCNNVELPLYKGNGESVFPFQRSGRHIKYSGEELSTPSTCASANCTNLKLSSDNESFNADASSTAIETVAIDDTSKAMDDIDSCTTATIKTSSTASVHACNLRRSKRTLAIKRKQYRVEDFLISNDFKHKKIAEERCEVGKESEHSLTFSTPSNRHQVCETVISKSLTSKKSSKSPKYPDGDHYRCWKCDFFVEVKYDRRKSYCRYRARTKLNIHFNGVHNSEELAFHDIDKLKVVIEGKDCFRCPRCDYNEEIKFNPKKHKDKIQGRKNARLKLGQHFFFLHCVPERHANLIPQVDVDLSRANKVNTAENSL